MPLQSRIRSARISVRRNLKTPAAIRLSSLITACSVVFLTPLLTAPAQAGPSFGIYDARTMGMGGVSVASSGNDNAQFYNAALLAFNDEIEEKTQDGRFLLPLLVPEFSESVIDIEEISREAVPDALATAVAEYNALHPDDGTGF